MHAMINGKMHPEYKAKWLEALRSGEYKQGRFQLCTREGEGEGFLGKVAEVDLFCCLGVLNEILNLGCSDDEARLWITNKDGSREQLPILDNNIQEYLIHMNDYKGMSFAQIADWIEENL